MTKLKDLSMNQLKEKAIEAGISKEDVGAFNSKAQLIAVINSLKSKPKLVDQTRSGDETPIERRNTDKSWLSKRDRMGRLLEKQPKVGMMIPIEPKEKPGVVESKVVNGIREFKVISGSVREKIINGYKWILPKGVMTQVPQQVYELLSKELNVMAQLGKEHLVDRVDPKTGKPVKDALK